MQIFVKTIDGKSVTIEISGTDKIIDIKKKVQEKIALQPDEQKFIFNGIVLEDEKTVEEYQIQQKSLINLVNKLRNKKIFVKSLDGKTVEIILTENDKIRDLKLKIQEKLALAPDEQRLVFQGVLLEDDKPIAEYNIADSSVVNVISRLRGGMKIATVKQQVN